MLDKAAGRDQHIVAVGEIDDFFELLLRHQRKGATGEFQRIDIFAHRLQDILQVALAHRSVVGATNFGDTACARFPLALIQTNKWKCSFTHDSISPSPFNGYAHLVRVIPRSTLLYLSFPDEPPFLRWRPVV